MTAPPGQLSLLPGCLSELDRAVLSFACAHHLQGRVDARVRPELGVTTTRYYQLLAALLDRPEAAEVAPTLIGQLQALRDRRRRYRAAPSTRGPVR